MPSGDDIEVTVAAGTDLGSFLEAAGKGHTSKLAHDLCDYIRHRAAAEGVGFDLNPEFFAGALRQGTEGFFGVQVRHGRMIRDDQEPRPGFLAEWLKDRSAH